jgi:cobaltochelatase CobS
MSDELKSPKVEDLVKVALREAMEKRKKSADIGMEHSLAIEEVDGKPTIVEVPTAVVLPSKPIPKADNQIYFSDIVKGGTAQDFAVSCFKDYSWNLAIASFVPEIDKQYIIDPQLASSILKAWELDEKVLCYGPTGAGKSSLIEQLCAHTYRPYIRVNCTGDMDSSMIFGQLTAKDGSTHWVDGVVTEAVRHGAVFAWDEWDVTPAEISMGLQWLLEDNGKLFLKEMPGSAKDKMISTHEFFRIVAIGNTQGQGDDTGAHAGTNVQNSATLDRFGTCVYVDYLPSTVEEKMIKSKWGHVVSPKAAKELVKLANLIRQGYKAGQFNLTFSPRTLFSICRKLGNGDTLLQAYTLAYLNKLNDTQRKVASELFTKIYGTTV